MPRIIELVGCLDVIVPDCPGKFRIRHRRRQLALRRSGVHFRVGFLPALRTRVEPLVPAFQRGVLHQHRVALEELDHGSEPFGVVSHHQEIERTAEPDSLPRGCLHFLAAREAIGALHPHGGTKHGGIDGERRVQVGVAPEDSRWIWLVCVRRIRFPRAPGPVCGAWQDRSLRCEYGDKP